MSAFSILCGAVLEARQDPAAISPEHLGYLIDAAHDEHATNYQFLHEAQQAGAATDAHVELFNAEARALAAVDALIEKWIPQ